MLKTEKVTTIELDMTINEKQNQPFINQKVVQAKKTLKRAGLPPELMPEKSTAPSQ